MYCQYPHNWYTLSMPKRHYRKLTDAATGLPFLFALETGLDSPLPIVVRHGVTHDGAIETFVEGTTTWSAINQRFETHTNSHAPY